MESPAVDVQAIMHDIRSRLRANQSQDVQCEADKIVSPALALSLHNLESQIRDLQTELERIGGIPPAPPTVRGRVGALLVRLVRRSLFWLIPPLQIIHIKIVCTLDETRRAVRELTAALRQVNAELIALRRSSPDALSATDAGQAWPDDGTRPANNEPITALLEELEGALAAQLRIQRELFTTLARQRARSVSAAREDE